MKNSLIENLKVCAFDTIVAGCNDICKGTYDEEVRNEEIEMHNIISVKDKVIIDFEILDNDKIQHSDLLFYSLPNILKDVLYASNMYIPNTNIMFIYLRRIKRSNTVTKKQFEDTIKQFLKIVDSEFDNVLLIIKSTSLYNKEIDSYINNGFRVINQNKSNKKPLIYKSNISEKIIDEDGYFIE